MERLDRQQLLEAEPFLGYLGLEVFGAHMGRAVLRPALRREATTQATSIHGGE